MLPCGRSRRDGSFAIQVWHPGPYSITAVKKSAGYPDARDAVYGTFFGTPPVVEVGESNELGQVDVVVGPKAGIAVLTMVDDETGRPVESGLVEVCRADDPRACSSRSTGFPGGRYVLLVPEVALTLRLSVWGGAEKDWEEREAVEEGGGPVKELRVDLGERKEIKLRLRRVTRDR